MDLGLKRVNALLKSLDNPQDKFPIIHVGGTNGKGSTSAMIASILVEAGYKTGLYTSPHLMRFNERIRINRREISDKKTAELVERIRERVQGFKGSRVRGQKKSATYPQPSVFSLQPTFFEFTTAMAFLYFAEEKVDIAVMEVGLGGRLDATNVAKPLVSVITNIAKDHQAILGNRIKDIAFEKAGITKKGGVLISGETKPAALKVLTAECKKKKAMFYRLDRDFFIDKGQESEVKTFTFQGRRWFYQDLTVNLLGRHQYLNAASALAALEVLEEKGFYLTESCIRKGLRNVLWPGRIEIASKRPLVILDCAHNPAGAKVLREALLDLRFAIDDLRMKNKNNNSKIEKRKSKVILVLGIMTDKDIKGIVSKLVPLASMIILTRPKTERAASLETLYREIRPYLLRRGEWEKRRNGEKKKESEKRRWGETGKKKEMGKHFSDSQILPFSDSLLKKTTRLSDSPIYSSNVMLIEDVADACRTAISMANADDIICISGSVFTVGEAKSFLLNKARA